MQSSGPSQLFSTGTANHIAKSTPSNTAVGQSGPDNRKLALMYCALLALQFGLQPMIATKFTNKEVSKTSVVIATELTKIWIAAVVIFSESATVREKIFSNWTLKSSLQNAALPACMYAIQNLLVQNAYQLLDSMTFNLLNQTKTLSAALCLYLVMNKRQSLIQVGALLLLLGAAVVLNLPTVQFTNEIPFMLFPTAQASTLNAAAIANYQLGVVMVLGASGLSGLSTALTQRALAGPKPRDALFFSAELAVYGILFLIVNMFRSGEAFSVSILRGWELRGLIPVLTNAFGGVVVGLVTKYAGGVVKGFALIAGIIITGFAQWFIEGKQLEANTWIAVVLVSISIYLHTSFPYMEKDTRSANLKKTN